MLEDHRLLGGVFSRARAAAQSVYIFASNKLDGRGSKLARLAAAAEKAIGALRCELDNMVFDEHPELSVKELGAVYYGEAERVTLVGEVPTGGPARAPGCPAERPAGKAVGRGSGSCKTS